MLLCFRCYHRICRSWCNSHGFRKSGQRILRHSALGGCRHHHHNGAPLSWRSSHWASVSADKGGRWTNEQCGTCRGLRHRFGLRLWLDTMRGPCACRDPVHCSWPRHGNTRCELVIGLWAGNDASLHCSCAFYWPIHVMDAAVSTALGTRRKVVGGAAGRFRSSHRNQFNQPHRAMDA